MISCEYPETVECIRSHSREVSHLPAVFRILFLNRAFFLLALSTNSSKWVIFANVSSVLAGRRFNPCPRKGYETLRPLILQSDRL